MSDSIYLKIQLKHEFYSFETSNFLFTIVEEGCKRKIALSVLAHENNNLTEYECLMSVSDSFNFTLVDPLIGLDQDYEVKEFRSEPLIDRLKVLQKLFEFIYKQEEVQQVEILLTSEELRFDEKKLSVELKKFAEYLEPLIKETKLPSFHYQFCWKK